MKSSTVTVKDILSFEPCEEWTEERIKKAFGKKNKVDALWILNQKHVSTLDRLWLVLREELLPAPVLQEFECLCTKRILQKERRAGKEPDPRSWAVIKAKRAWLKGEITDEELAVALEGARNTWWTTNATWAARVVVWWDTGGDEEKAERKWQIATLKKMLVK